jgi:hypothetical protein
MCQGARIQVFLNMNFLVLTYRYSIYELLATVEDFQETTKHGIARMD